MECDALINVFRLYVVAGQINQGIPIIDDFVDSQRITPLSSNRYRYATRRIIAFHIADFTHDNL